MLYSTYGPYDWPKGHQHEREHGYSSCGKQVQAIRGAKAHSDRRKQ